MRGPANVLRTDPWCADPWLSIGPPSAKPIMLHLASRPPNSAVALVPALAFLCSPLYITAIMTIEDGLYMMSHYEDSLVGWIESLLIYSEEWLEVGFLWL